MLAQVPQGILNWRKLQSTPVETLVEMVSDRGSTPLASTKERVLEHADLCHGVSVRVSYEAAGSIELARLKIKSPPFGGHPESGFFVLLLDERQV